MASIRYRIRKFLFHNVLHADDAPHAIALGAGIAMFVAFLPLVGIQTFVAIGIAALFRANKAICVPIVWITNPATFVPIYWGCLRLGRLVVPSGALGHDGTMAELKHVAENASVFTLSFWRELMPLLFGLGAELWVGCTIVGVALAVPCYFIVRWGATAYRERRRQRLLQRNLFRAKFQKSHVARRSEPA